MAKAVPLGKILDRNQKVLINPSCPNLASHKLLEFRGHSSFNLLGVLTLITTLLFFGPATASSLALCKISMLSLSVHKAHTCTHLLYHPPKLPSPPPPTPQPLHDSSLYVKYSIAMLVKLRSISSYVTEPASDNEIIHKIQKQLKGE